MVDIAYEPKTLSRLIATDVDSAMLDGARRRLASFKDRVDVRHADATELPFPNERFDAVVSFIMLHHTLQWERALSEAARVLRPGGILVGYDVVSSAPARIFHRLDRSPHRLAALAEFSTRFADLPLEDVRVEAAFRRLIVRFEGVRAGRPEPPTLPVARKEAHDHGDLPGVRHDL